MPLIGYVDFSFLGMTGRRGGERPTFGDDRPRKAEKGGGGEVGDGSWREIKSMRDSVREMDVVEDEQEKCVSLEARRSTREEEEEEKDIAVKEDE